MKNNAITITARVRIHEQIFTYSYSISSRLEITKQENRAATTEIKESTYPDIFILRSSFTKNLYASAATAGISAASE